MEEISISPQALEKLLGAADPDACLVYLAQLAGSVPVSLSPQRLQQAQALLCQLGLEPAPARPPLLRSEQRPEYTEQDVLRRMEQPNSGFQRLVGEVQRYLSRVLSTQELQILLSIYEYVGLDPEIINMLVHYCVERSRSRGSGRMPSFRTIEREAYHWADEGIDSLELASAFVRQQGVRRSRMGQLTRLLGIEGRRLTQTEEKYLTAWADLDLPEQTFRLAYDKTVMNTGGLKWPYMNSILQRWHSQGLRTPEQIEQYDRKPAAKPTAKPADQFQRHGQALSPMLRQAAERLMEEEEANQWHTNQP